MIAGTDGYAQEAGVLLERYESIAVAEKHAPVIHLIPKAPSSVLDIGAGTGADAAYLAAMGHRVVAVEPVAELRVPGMALHPSALIEWVDDSLPALAATRRRGERFDLVMMTSVWMHLDEPERREAMPGVAALVREGGLLILSLRRGPVPPGRRMFEVSAAETIRLAQAHGLRCILDVETPGLVPGNRAAGVTQSRLAFVSTAAGRQA